MAFDGITTRKAAGELAEKLCGGKFDKVYQPEAGELVFTVHTREGNLRFFFSCASASARIHLTKQTCENPESPTAFCMLLRKHLTGGRILSVTQHGTERIIEIDVESRNELGFSVKKRIIAEIMGKHSNFILCDGESGKIIDCIKRVSIDVNRVRQLLPGKRYEYPPQQEKTPYDAVTEAELETICGGSREALAERILEGIGGLSPAAARSLAAQAEGEPAAERVAAVRRGLAYFIGAGSPCVYLDAGGKPVDFHSHRLQALEEGLSRKDFPSVSEACEYFFLNRESGNRVKQRSGDLHRAVRQVLDKHYLKKQRLSEDLLKAENSENYRLYGELLNANIHLIKTGDARAEVVNYYDGAPITIPLDVRFSAAKNAQNYFKKYGKAKTAVKEKAIQLAETEEEICYLESVLSYAERAETVEETEALREELIEGGFLRRRKNGFRVKKNSFAPYAYTTTDGFRMLAGRNNLENDRLTLKLADNRDLWFHTKDIPGSHVILFTGGLCAEEIPERTMYEAAAAAAWHSKGRSSENVPVDYALVKHVKKPSGAKPGMVIFTNNRTVWVNPALPEGREPHR